MLSNAPKRESAPLPPQGRRVSAQYPTPHGQGRGLSDLPPIEIDGRWSGHGGFSAHLPLQAVLEPPQEGTSWIADLGDATRHIRLAGLVALRREPEVSADLLGRREPPRIVDRRDIGERHDCAHAGRRHRNLTRSSVFAIARTRFSKPWNSLARIERAASSASATTISVAWPDTRTRTRPSKVRGVVAPTFKPKPRRIPRRLISTSWSFVCTSLRALRSPAPPAPAAICSAPDETSRAASAG
jgi:hypothetical protein